MNIKDLLDMEFGQLVDAVDSMSQTELSGVIAQLPDEVIRATQAAISLEQFQALTLKTATYVGVEETKQLLGLLAAWLDDDRTARFVEQKQTEYEGEIEVARLTQEGG